MPRRPKPSGNNFPEISGEPPFEFIIAERGDILLEIRDKTSGQDYCFRCSRNVLSSASGYFDVLFDPAKFSEGIAIHKELQALYKQHDGPIPASKLPRVSVADLGELPNGGSLPPILAVTTFLKILQDPNTTWPVDRFQSLNLVALLAIIADRFDAPKRVAIYLRTQALDVTLLKTKRPTTPSAIELENRQRLLSGIIFGFPQWVLQSSSALIVEGSMRWKVKHYDHETESDKDIDGALWWRLPSGIEDELYCRREYVLETLASIQKHFINLYSSRQPQCKLGYDSSPRCDSYQLGEIIRFFTRKGLLRIESAFAPTPDEGLDPYVGSVDDVIGRLRECTSYQLDSFHQHCGLRTRLLPILDTIWPLNQVWICLDCWKGDRSKESWLENPHGGTWYQVKRARPNGGCEAHRHAKAMYTANRRNWTP